jgi:osmotically inducible protein OsmC
LKLTKRVAWCILGFTTRSTERPKCQYARHLRAGPTIALIELKTEAEVPGIDEAAFLEHAAAAKAKCPVSKALAAVETTLAARLVG